MSRDYDKSCPNCGEEAREGELYFPNAGEKGPAYHLRQCRVCPKFFIVKRTTEFIPVAYEGKPGYPNNKDWDKAMKLALAQVSNAK